MREYPGMFEKMNRELKILKSFNHPHIIKLYEFINTKEDVYFILEYAAGGELSDLIAINQSFNENIARKIF